MNQYTSLPHVMYVQSVLAAQSSPVKLPKLSSAAQPNRPTLVGFSQLWTYMPHVAQLEFRCLIKSTIFRQIFITLTRELGLIMPSTLKIMMISKNSSGSNNFQQSKNRKRQKRKQAREEKSQKNIHGQKNQFYLTAFPSNNDKLMQFLRNTIDISTQTMFCF